MTDIQNRHSKKDAYTFLPLLFFLPISLVESVLLMFEPGGILGSWKFWLAFVMFVISAVAWLVVALISIVRRRWRGLLSVLFAGCASIAAMAACMAFEDEIYFRIMRPFYLAEIARSKGVSKMEWPWKGGLGFDKRLVFDKTRAGNLGVGQELERRGDNCTYTTRRLSEDFYLQTMICNVRG